MDTKNYAKEIKNNNFTISNRKKSNIAIAILGNIIYKTIVFVWTNNIFGDFKDSGVCICQKFGTY